MLINNILNNKLTAIIVFILFGFFGTLPIFPTFFGFFIIIFGAFIIFSSNNRNEEIFIVCAFIVGAEIFIRMIGGFILYETGKYAVIVFLFLGMILGEFKQKFSFQYYLYIFLLLLGIVFTNVPEGESMRKAIAFNLSGPFALGVAALYFYKRPISEKQLYDALFFMLLPIFSTVTYLYFRTPDLSEIVFGGVANFETSGGFGPNQVATILGLGVLLLTIFLVSKKKLTGYIFLDVLFLIYFIYRALLTFSRGGLITGIICVVTFAFFFALYKKISIGVLFKYLGITAFFIVAIWLYTSDITGGMLDNRYTGKNARGVQKEDISSGRGEIFELQFDNFMENPLGIGVGNGKYERKGQIKHVTAASHNEVGRLLEEHGFIGFVLLILLLIVPLFNFFKGNNYQKGFIIAFYLMWFLTINHSAMRVALPGFIYALSLIIITDIDE